MRLLQINSVYNYGSTGRIAGAIGRGAARDGESLICYGRGKTDDGACYRIGTDLDVYSHVILCRLSDRCAFFSARATKKLIKRIEEFSPDVILLHNLHGYYLNIELLFGFLSSYGRPVAWTLHDCWSYTGHCSHYEFRQCEKWLTGCHDCVQSGEYPRALRDGSAENYADKKRIFTSLDRLTLITPSEWLAGEVRRSYLGKYEVRVINNGINTSVFTPEGEADRHGAGRDERLIFSAASVWNERKGLGELYRLRGLLDDGYKILVAGLSDRQLRSLPRGITGIRRTGSVEALAALYRGTDLFVCPTLEDNYPTVNLEAQSCGTPVVTYASGGSPETIIYGEAVKKLDVAALAQSVIRNANAKKDLTVQDIRTNVMSRFDSSVMIDGYIKLLSSLM